MQITEKCNICDNDEIHLLVDFGCQFVSHHFLKSATEKENSYQLTLAQCVSCRTVQLSDRVPIDKLRPRYDWLKCNEPEAHLDSLVTIISRLPGVTKDSQIGAMSFKDDSTLGRFNKLGFKNTYRVNVQNELGITHSLAWFESVQANFNQESAERIIHNHGKSDIFIARHILEHAYHPRKFIACCKQMIRPQGYIVFEIPDCQRAFENFDYTTIWEEHVAYFTGETFRNALVSNGLSLVYFDRIPYSVEDSYVAITQIAQEDLSFEFASEEKLKKEELLAKQFANGYIDKREFIRQFFINLKKENKRVALFGAGHMSSVFLNLFGLQDFIEFVVDDNPNMKNLFMPGSRLPILETKFIYKNDVDVCILTLSESSEEKVLDNNQPFLRRGGKFLSIFPGSKLAIKF